MQRIFVYGTLKRGFENHRYLGGQRYLGEGRTIPGFRMYLLDGYPGMVASKGAGSIDGEIWEVDLPCLAALDDLEGVEEGLYERKAVALLPPHDQESVQTYLYMRSTEGRKELGSSWP